MSDVSVDEGGGDYPPYREDFFQRIINVNWSGLACEFYPQDT